MIIKFDCLVWQNFAFLDVEKSSSFNNLTVPRGIIYLTEGDVMGEKEKKTVFWKNPRIMKWGVLGIVYGILGPLIFVFAGYGWPNVVFILITIPFIPSAITGFIASNLMEWYTCRGGICEGGVVNYIINFIPNTLLWFSIGCIFGYVLMKLRIKHNDKK